MKIFYHENLEPYGIASGVRHCCVWKPAFLNVIHNGL